MLTLFFCIISLFFYFSYPQPKIWGTQPKNCSRRLWRRVFKSTGDWPRLKNREFRLARQGANCHVGLGHGSGESDKLYSSPKMGVTDVTVGVTVTSRLHRSYCCSRIPLLFCCYCSTLQHCSVPNVEVLYFSAPQTRGLGRGRLPSVDAKSKFHAAETRQCAPPMTIRSM